MIRLNRAAHPAYQGGRSRLIQLNELIQASQALLKETNASVVLGVALFNTGEQQDLVIASITPLGQQERHLTYGGHPKNAARWAVNTALDWLRRSTKEVG
jgi:hypothetical protein